mgnify:CR=1 FL=1
MAGLTSNATAGDADGGGDDDTCKHGLQPLQLIQVHLVSHACVFSSHQLPHIAGGLGDSDGGNGSCDGGGEGLGDGNGGDGDSDGGGDGDSDGGGDGDSDGGGDGDADGGGNGDGDGGGGGGGNGDGSDSGGGGSSGEVASGKHDAHPLHALNEEHLIYHTWE